MITASILILVGCIIFGGVMTMLKWDFKKLATVTYETNRYEINETYENISIAVDTADIKLVPSEDGKTIVECVEETKRKHSVKAENGTLEIKCTDTRKWYEHIGINFQTTKITVYLPAGEYAALSVKATTGNTEIAKDFKFDSIDISATTGDIKNAASASGDIRINTTTGDIHMENVSAKNVSLSVSTGRITVIGLICENDFHNKVRTGDTKLSNITCANLFSEGTTGYLALKNVLATEKFSIRRDTGDVTFEDCDAGEIFVKTDTGKISGTLLSEKDFSSCRSDTGSLRVPKNGSGGKCELVTDTGNITIELSRHP
jgi:DUF4097 and DUF4098 domain-containing protein YvlB